MTTKTTEAGAGEMSKLHTVLMPNGKDYASRDAWMMMHPGFNAGYESGDLVALAEGVFVLNDDLVPNQLATDDQVQSAIAQEWNDKPDWAEQFSNATNCPKTDSLDSRNR